MREKGPERGGNTGKENEKVPFSLFLILREQNFPTSVCPFSSGLFPRAFFFYFSAFLSAIGKLRRKGPFFFSPDQIPAIVLSAKIRSAKECCFSHPVLTQGRKKLGHFLPHKLLHLPETEIVQH